MQDGFEAPTVEAPDADAAAVSALDRFVADIEADGDAHHACLCRQVDVLLDAGRLAMLAVLAEIPPQSRRTNVATHVRTGELKTYPALYTTDP